ncbi:major capsid protein [Flavobacterium oreochromis]|uniref:major capsid protein n=1 Tax=Flavobacterium oreochromis TaxID=2906078 RepID=UPI001CE4C015|nr:major capsid protein [Flavobacterium oreochromis]QYS85414.1 major capsid protein [Flavobacterium oreochromis]
MKKINGSNSPLTYLHREMLTKEFSPTLRWNSLSVNNVAVSADIVAMDSSLPLKRRDSLRKADGEIPKLGMALSLNETQMNELNILIATNAGDGEIFKKLFKDSERVVQGIYERLEAMFLESLSTGLTVITDEKNPGLGIRINFEHPEANKYGVVIPWSDPKAKPIDDIDRVIDKARDKHSNVVRYIMMDKTTFNKFRSNAQVKEKYAFFLGFTGTNIPSVPNVSAANEFLSASYQVEIKIVNRSIITEKDGKRSSYTPWASNAVVFLTDLNVGTLTYGKLAEETFKVQGVDYAKVDDFILVSKYHENNPIKEFTTSQALVLPVIQNIDAIYIMNCEEAVTDVQTEGDAGFAYNSKNYTKSSVVSAINTAVGSTKAKSTNKDETLLTYINELSEEQILIFEANITLV